MTPDLEAIVARHIKTIEEVHWPSGLVTHPESCLACDKAWPCDARQLADALTAAEAVGEDWYQQFIRAASKADAAEAELGAARDTITGLREAEDRAEADADALAEALREQRQTTDPLCFCIYAPVADDDEHSRYCAAALAALAAHDARRADRG